MLPIIIVMCVPAAFVAGRVVQWRRMREELDYLEERDRVGDLGVEGELRQTRRQLAGLLASPRLYLRARRVLAPLELERDDITAELELLEMT